MYNKADSQQIHKFWHFFAISASVIDQWVDVMDICKNVEKSHLYVANIEHYIVVESFIWKYEIIRIEVFILHLASVHIHPI